MENEYFDEWGNHAKRELDLANQLTSKMIATVFNSYFDIPMLESDGDGYKRHKPNKIYCEPCDYVYSENAIDLIGEYELLDVFSGCDYNAKTFRKKYYELVAKII